MILFSVIVVSSSPPPAILMFPLHIFTCWIPFSILKLFFPFPFSFRTLCYWILTQALSSVVRCLLKKSIFIYSASFCNKEIRAPSWSSQGLLIKEFKNRLCEEAQRQLYLSLKINPEQGSLVSAWKRKMRREREQSHAGWVELALTSDVQDKQPRGRAELEGKRGKKPKCLRKHTYTLVSTWKKKGKVLFS